MRDAILSIPTQLAAGIRLGDAVRLQKPYRFIISTGMGGSALPGEMLSMVQDNVIVHWDYDLPSNVGQSDLVICTSWSGDTEETLSSYEKARAAGMDILAITSGGKLAELAKRDGTPLVLLPNGGLAPRTATGYMTGALFAALGHTDLLPPAVNAADIEEEGKALAAKLGGRMLAMYAAYPWRKITGFWKMAYSETTKRQVMVNWFPSGAHNEVVGWEGPYRDGVVFLFVREEGEAHRYAKNTDALLAILSQKGYTVHTAWLRGNTVLQKVFHSYLLALWTAFHVATGLGLDPKATELLDEFKRLKAQA